MPTLLDRPSVVAPGWTDAEWETLINALSRRRLISGGLALGLVSCLPATASGQDATPVAGFPRTVKHPMGETVIPAQPKRIVAGTDEEPLDDLLAIGLKPILYGVTHRYELDLMPWVTPFGVADIPSFDMRNYEPDLERIAGAQPDLILDAWTEPDTYERMSGIAPTVVVKKDDTNLWREVQRLIGVATGHEAEAAQAIAETDAVIEAAAERLAPYRDRSVTIAYEFLDQFLINGSQAAIGRLVVEFGLSVQAPDQTTISALSLEQIRTVEDADILLSPIFYREDVEKMEANPLFRMLPAVKAGRYVMLPVEVSRAAWLESN